MERFLGGPDRGSPKRTCECGIWARMTRCRVSIAVHLNSKSKNARVPPWLRCQILTLHEHACGSQGEQSPAQKGSEAAPHDCCTRAHWRGKCVVALAAAAVCPHSVPEFTRAAVTRTHAITLPMQPPRMHSHVPHACAVMFAILLARVDNKMLSASIDTTIN